LPFCQQNITPSHFLTKGNSLTILSEDKDYNNKAETLTIGQGDDLKIGFNARFLSELLSNLESESIDRNVTTK
jgi:DNA polymerase III sliding clamp (beta) subunit (PCNA family)